VAAVATAKPASTGTANFSAWANVNLTALTEQVDNTTNVGNGGGIGVATGVKAPAGAYGLDAWDRPVFVARKARGRARTQAASAARWRDYDTAARSDALRRVVSFRWARTSRAERLAVVAQLNSAKRTRVAMLPSVLPVLRVVTIRGEVPVDEVCPEDMVCQKCGVPAALPYRPSPLRERVGTYLCRRHARISRALYADTAGLSLGLLHSSAAPGTTAHVRDHLGGCARASSLPPRPAPTARRHAGVRARRAKTARVPSATPAAPIAFRSRPRAARPALDPAGSGGQLAVSKTPAPPRPANLWGSPAGPLLLDSGHTAALDAAGVVRS